MRHVATASLRCALVLALFLGSALPLRAEFAELIRRVPADANAILLIDVERVLASPIGKREGWEKRHAANFAERPFYLPPHAKKVVRAAHLDLQAQESIWELAMMDATRVPKIGDIATREKGYVDHIGSTEVAWSPRGAYAVKLGPSAIGLTFPPNRQFLARWLKEPSGKISPYLLAASQSMATTDAQMLLAIDVDDAIEPTQTRARLKESAAIKQAGINPDELANLILQLRGIKFEVVLKEKAWGRLQLEFGQDPAAVVPVAKPLVIEALQRFGAALDDIASWTVTKKGNAVSLYGELSDGGLMRLSSLFELPSLEQESEETPEVDKPMLYATQHHFKSVNKLLDDLVSEKRDSKTMGQLAAWVVQYAKRIDRLPIVNVDPDMLAYSAGVAEDLRQIAASLKGYGIQSGVRTAQTYDSGGWGYYDGYYGNRAVNNERRAIRAQERGQTATTSTQIADHIRADTSNIRRQMSERYKVEF